MYDQFVEEHLKLQEENLKMKALLMKCWHVLKIFPDRKIKGVDYTTQDVAKEIEQIIVD